ncbi:hypothetical protein C823_003162 [Eubacterium plexicaudatum ASF492]|nr:hypothetical protein C823_003162 [Eubacterium plexicaudatum ASF492]
MDKEEYDYVWLPDNGTGDKKTKGNVRTAAETDDFFCGLFYSVGHYDFTGVYAAGISACAAVFFYSVLSQKEYEYVLEGQTLTIDVILGKRYRKTVHVLELNTMEATAPNRHDAVARYRKDTGTIRLPKYDYTSYDKDTPFYTMIIMENRQKIKLLLDLSEEMLQALKKSYPDRVFLS